MSWLGENLADGGDGMGVEYSEQAALDRGGGNKGCETGGRSGKAMDVLFWSKRRGGRGILNERKHKGTAVCRDWSFRLRFMGIGLGLGW